ncbi:MAG: ATP-binding protein [Patescibacteria group bacterium]
MSSRNRRDSRQNRRDFAAQIAERSTSGNQPLIQHQDEGIFIPHGADLGEIISELDAIQADRQSSNESVQIEIALAIPPWEGAHALTQAVKQLFGMVRQLPDRSKRREQLRIPISIDETLQVPWGILDLPGLSGQVEMLSTQIKGHMAFQMRFYVVRRYERRVEEIIRLVRTLAGGEPIHRKQAFSIAFRDDEGELLPMAIPEFFAFTEETPIFTKALTDAVERNILVPIMYGNELAQRGTRLKRGILFAGQYGVGKTMLASHVGRMAIDAGWTFIYVKNSADLPHALRFAERYQPVVLFAEDIDRVAGIDRTDKVNELLNQLDGVDSKTARMITVLTTNHLESINAAMKRPKRIDKILKVVPPDAETVERMLYVFGGSTLAEGIDLSKPAQLLAGQSPARIREVLESSTLEVLRRTSDIDAKIVAEDLVAMAEEMLAEDAAMKELQP